MKNQTSVLDGIYEPNRVTSKALDRICDLLNEVAPLTQGHHKDLRYDKWLIHTRGSEAPYWYVLARQPEGSTGYMEFSQAMTAGNLWGYICNLIRKYEFRYRPSEFVFGMPLHVLAKRCPMWFRNTTSEEIVIMYGSHLITHGNEWFPGVKLWKVGISDDRTRITNVLPDHFKLGDTSFHSVQQAMEQACQLII